jgi:hypothetical protein
MEASRQTCLPARGASQRLADEANLLISNRCQLVSAVCQLDGRFEVLEAYQAAVAPKPA